MGNGKRVLDLCGTCKEYISLVEEYCAGALKGDYNSWTGLGISLDNVLGEGELGSEELGAIGPICKECENSPGIYKGRKSFAELKKWWEGVNEKSNTLPKEECNEYIVKQIKKEFNVDRKRGLIICFVPHSSKPSKE